MSLYLFLCNAIIIICLVFSPGVLWNLLFRRKLALDFLPIPGICLLSMLGCLAWKLDINLVFVFARILYVASFICLLSGMFCGRYELRSNEEGMIVLIVACLVFSQAAAIGNNPLPIGQEFNSGSLLPGRMIASPPDHAIPFDTARYFFAGLDGLERSKEFFGEWNVTSRGPLVPFGINALFHLFIPEGGQESYGLSSIIGGPQHLARIYGWLLNSLVVLGVFSVCRAAQASKTTLVVAIVWVALAPVTIINVVFIWPKLLATYFILLAVSSVIQNKMFTAGMLMGLGWLSHPVGALALPALWVFQLLSADDRHEKCWIVRTVLLVSGCFVVMMPWIFYKLSLAAPDPFLKYFLGGGEGLKPAQTYRGWLETRWNNIAYTIIPFKFFFDGRMTNWLYGPLNNGLRWFVQYAKELPGQLGFTCFIVAYTALAQFKKTRISIAFMSALILIFFLTQIVFWGFSSDGLGRNSLEPLTVLIIVFSCIFYDKSKVWMYAALPALALEGQILQISGFIFDFNVVADIDLTKGTPFLLVSMMCSLSILALFYLNIRREN